MKINSDIRRLLQLFLVLIFVITLGMGVWLSMNRDRLFSDQSVPISSYTSNCDPVEGPCELQTGTGETLVFQILGEPVYLQPFPMQLHLRGWEDVSDLQVNARFQMENMYMGELKTGFKQGHANDNTVWTGSGLLPVCVSGRVDWYVVLQLVSKTETVEAKFYFHVKASR